MTIRLAIITIVSGAELAGAAAANAGRRCDVRPPSPQAIERGMQLAQHTAAALDAAHARDGTRVVLLARAGQNR